MIHSVIKYQEKLRIKSEGLNPTPNLCKIKLLSTHYFPLVNREIITLLELIYLIIINEITFRSTDVCIDFGCKCLQTAGEELSLRAVFAQSVCTWLGVQQQGRGDGGSWQEAPGRWHCHPKPFWARALGSAHVGGSHHQVLVWAAGASCQGWRGRLC